METTFKEFISKTSNRPFSNFFDDLKYINTLIEEDYPALYEGGVRGEQILSLLLYNTTSFDLLEGWMKHEIIGQKVQKQFIPSGYELLIKILHHFNFYSPYLEKKFFQPTEAIKNTLKVLNLNVKEETLLLLCSTYTECKSISEWDTEVNQLELGKEWEGKHFLFSSIVLLKMDLVDLN